MATAKGQSNEITVVQCNNILDVPTMIAFKKKLRKRMNKNKSHVVLDLGRTQRVNLAGLSILVDRIKEVRATEGDIRLCGLNAQVKRTFKLVGVLKMVETYSSKEKAARSFQLA